MPPVLTRNGDALELALAGCRGTEFEDAKDKIKEVPGRRFDFERKVWIVPAEPAVAERVLKTIRPDCDQELIDWVRESRTSSEESLTTPLPDNGKLLIPWANKRMPWQPEEVNDEPFDGLLPYQRAAVDAMATWGRAILADDMGLGKTMEAISAVEEWRLRNDGIDGPKLVVCPNSVKGSWARELSRWLENPIVRIIDGNSPAARRKQLTAAVRDNAWIIVNWEQLRVQKKKIKLPNGGRKTITVMKEPLFEQTPWLAVIADEVHRAKNRKAQQTMGLWRVKSSFTLEFGLTGTPLQNSPDELWSILRWLWPEEYGRSTPASANKPAHPRTAYWAFYEDYVEYWEDHFGKKVITGVKNPDALRFALKDKLIRRTAGILGLKGRKRIFFPIKLNPKQQKLYDEAVKAMWLEVRKEAEEGSETAQEFLDALERGAPAYELYRIPNGAARMVRQQQIIENPAILGGDDDSALMDDFEERFEDSRPAQWVVFCKYKPSCDLLANRLRQKHGAEVGVYYGDTSTADRTKMEDAFQRGEIDVIVGTVAAMKEGITLTASHLQYFLSRDFVPDVNEQCESRCDRLGQQELVRIYIPMAVGTVAESRVLPINRLKESIVRTVIPKDEIEQEEL